MKDEVLTTRKRMRILDHMERMIQEAIRKHVTSGDAAKETKRERNKRLRSKGGTAGTTPDSSSQSESEDATEGKTGDEVNGGSLYPAVHIPSMPTMGQDENPVSYEYSDWEKEFMRCCIPMGHER